MNKKETAEAIKVMQAYVDGAEIELRIRHTNESWHRCDPVWHWQSYEYRVKPKPREFFVSAYAKHGDHLPVPSYAKDCTTFIKVREVE